MTVRCAQCGAGFDEHISYCGSCGAPLPGTMQLPMEEQEVVDPLLGAVIDGRYRVLSRLGEGGMGAVYKVEHVHMGKFMAMKMLLREFGGNRDLVRRFRREAHAVSRLSSINTVQVFDFGRSSEGAMYMVMEYIEGETLASLLNREGPLPVERMARIVAQLCGSLGEAHAEGIIHRDLKPENVMLIHTRDRRDFVKVLDFGLAKLREKDGGATSHGSLVGTPYYMSPEQIRGREVDPRSDIYSLGAMMFKMLTGQPPFKAPSPIAVLTKHLQEAPPTLRAVNSESRVSGAVEAVLRRAMAKEPAQRLQNVDELKRALETAMNAPATGATDAQEGFTFEEEESEWSWASDMNIGNRRDFDRFEKRLRRWRVLRWVMVLLVLGGGSATLSWGYLEGGWFERNSESEPNNIRGQANRISPDRRVKAFIGRRVAPGAGDRDWYRLSPPKGHPRVLRLEVSGIPNIDLSLEVYRNKRVRRPTWSANNGGIGRGEVIPNLFVTRPIYLLVREVPRTGRVPTENSSDPYYLTASFRPLRDGQEEREPNDAPRRATPVSVGVLVEGLAGRRKDRDYYRFPRSGEKGEIFEIHLTPPAGVELRARVIAGGLRLPDKLPGKVTLPAGDRYLFVEILTLRGFSPDRPYRLRVVRGK